MKSRKHLGIYIHIPFCMRKCIYCDFLSAPADQETQAAYVHALIREINSVGRQKADCLRDYEVHSVFFGGGTPSIISAEAIMQILETLRAHFTFLPEAEITIECNPGTLTAQKAQLYKQAGINRISFGAQAADNDMLRLLERIHTAETFEESMNIARDAGFHNINVDVMSALPGQTVLGYENSLKRILTYAPEHISAYSLIVEEDTPLYRHLKEYPPLPDEDAEREMYYLTRELLEDAGYRQYEISNYAKPGFACRHNLSYWERHDYLGFGIGAASLFEGYRMSNIRELQEYIKRAGNSCVVAENTKLTPQACMEEFMFLGLRKTAGIDGADFMREFGKRIESVYGEVLEKYIRMGLIEKRDKSVYRLSLRGMDVSNIIFADFLL